MLLQQTHAWLLPEQRKLARLAIKCPTADYSGQLRLEKRSPRISCQTISNLAVTARTFEETILLDFLIEDAGVGELVFLLPVQLRNARISAPLVRQKTVEETDDESQVRIRLELQDEDVMGQYRVLVEMDRLLTAEPHSVPVPLVETGTTTRRFVALETAGREEVVVEQQEGLEPLGPRTTGVAIAHRPAGTGNHPGLPRAIERRDAAVGCSHQRPRGSGNCGRPHSSGSNRVDGGREWCLSRRDDLPHG